MSRVKQIVCADCGEIDNELLAHHGSLMWPKGPCDNCGCTVFEQKLVVTEGEEADMTL